MKKSTPDDPEMTRSTPRQARSRQRRERILLAAAEVFASSGYETATTEAIAARAGTSIGSLYRFFPDKRALFDALVEQYLERSRALFDAMFEVSRDTPWHALVDGAIDAFDALQRTEPAFRAVWKNWLLSPRFVEAGTALNKAFAKRIEVFLDRHAKAPLAPAERERVATVVVEVVSAMLFVAMGTGGAKGRALVGETKVLVKRYLAPLAREPPREGAPVGKADAPKKARVRR
jgi:AcrR family transcriptional regulator